MKIVRLHSLLLICAITAFGICIPSTARSLPSGGSAAGKFPEIRKALAALNLAADDLENADDDFCGYRVAALNAVNAAINQLQLAIQCAGGPSTSQNMAQALNLRAQLVSLKSSAAKEHHPLIRQAIAACEIAATALENAAHDYCGHRADALEATLAAIGEMELAIACDPH